MFAYGLLCIGFACLASLLGEVLQASLSVMGVMAGPLLGLFSIGIVFPCTNSIVSLHYNRPHYKDCRLYENNWGMSPRTLL